MAQKQIQFQSMEEVREQFTLKPIKNKNTVSRGVINKFGNAEPASYRGEKGESPFKEMIAKLSRGLMLPIALLPIAGLFLGIGSAIVTQAQNNSLAGLEIFGKVLKVPGDAIFGNLPVLFCIAIAITFANDKGVAGLAGVVGWIAFCAFQSALIQQTDIKDAAGNVLYSNYKFLFYNFVQGSDSIWTPEIFNTIFTSNMGIKSLQTSIVGGMTIGGITAFLYNRFKTIQFPQILGFFQGERFVPILMFVVSLVVSLLFCIIWPLFGFALYKFGSVAGKAPAGLNSLAFGYVERALVPTGLHHAFYSPLWYTAAGGSMSLANTQMRIWVDGKLHEVVGYTTWQAFATAQGLTRTDWNIQGDQNCWMFIYSIAGKTVQLKDTGAAYTITFDTFKQLSLHDVEGFAGVNAGQYMQGKFPFMLLGLPAAAMGIVMAAPKGDGRKAAMSAVLGSALTCFVTGITEPLEFTFLFLAPALYFGLHALLCAISFWLMNLFGAHCGLTFSGGAIDYVIYGILPDAMGDGTKCWLAPLIGAGLAVIYFFGFWGIIVRSDIKTPGREGASNKLMTRADYNAKKAGGSSAPSSSSSATPASASAEPSSGGGNADGIDVSKLSDDEKQAYEVIYAYGGKKNIRSIEACITKLRVDVNKATEVDDKKLVELGAHGVVHPSNKSVYAVFGTKADIIKSLMQDLLDKMKE